MPLLVAICSTIFRMSAWVSASAAAKRSTF